MSAIEIENLCKTFRGKKRVRVEALRSMSLSIEKGESFGFLGPNGAGKSTTIKILMGLLKPTSGSVRLMGAPAGNPHSRKMVGFLPENPAFYDFLSGEEYLRFAGESFGMRGVELERGLNRVLDLLNLVEARKRPLRSYSKGMVQRLGLAQALVHDPEVLVLDEPMSGLDPVGRALVKEILNDLRLQGKTIFFSTHITPDVEVMCDRVGVIVQGELKASERVQDILDRQISGYDIETRLSGQEVLEKHFVETDKLDCKLETLRAEGHELVSVETRRQNLENYFLGFVNPV